MKTKLTKILTIVFAASMLLTGCNNSAESNNSIESNNKLTIVTSFYPMYISTLNIVKDIPDVEVINMTAPQTGCLHDYSLSTKDLKTLSSADIFVINGAGMESFLDDVIDEYSDLKIKLANEYPNDRIAYTNGKSKLIEEILNSASMWRKCNDYKSNNWKSIRYLSKRSMDDCFNLMNGVDYDF